MTRAGADGGRSTAAGDPLGGVLRITEDSFVAAGDALARAVEILRGTEALFARLDAALGAAATAELARLIAQSFADVARVRADFDGFVQDGAALRRAVRGVGQEVDALDRVVRTMSNAAVNARILGHALIPPRPQVDAFVERLAVMASEADGVLQEVKDAMAGIGQDAHAIDAAVQALRQELLMQVLPALGRFAAIAEQAQDRRAEMARVGGDLSGRMQAVFDEVSRLIVALQVGDATRQRLDRVSLLLAIRDAAPAGQVPVLSDLARALAEGASGDAAAAVAVSLAALEEVRGHAAQAMDRARQFYFAQAGRDRDGQGSGETESLQQGLARVARLLDAMRARAGAMGGRLDLIHRHEATVRRIAQQVRLSGLNAMLVCAKLGEEGRSLRELAEWLRTLTDEGDAIVRRLQDRLDATRAAALAAGRAGVDRLEVSLSALLGDAGALGGAMGHSFAVVADAARGFDAAGRELPQRLGQAAARLAEFDAALGGVDGLTLGLRLRALGQPAPVADEGDAGLVAALEQMRARYSMQKERAIHDAVVAAAMGRPAAAAPAVGAAGDAAAEGDGLDDILF